jgi:hypothetical protein
VKGLFKISEGFTVGGRGILNSDFVGDGESTKSSGFFYNVIQIMRPISPSVISENIFFRKIRLEIGKKLISRAVEWLSVDRGFSVRLFV